MQPPDQGDCTQSNRYAYIGRKKDYTRRNYFMNDILALNIRRKLDKNEKVGTNEIRALLATLTAYKNRIETLEIENSQLKALVNILQQPAEKVQS